MFQYALHSVAPHPHCSNQSQPYSVVIELGAGTALPSLLASTLPTPPILVVVTDYPDDLILNNLQSNIDRNSGSITPPCIVQCRGYEWGKDPSHLL